MANLTAILAFQFFNRKFVMAEKKGPGSSNHGKCPLAGISTYSEPAISSWILLFCGAGQIKSSSPEIIKVGVDMFLI